MALSSLQLEAFSEVARCGSFSLAARKLRLTQSALSQRIINLERQLATALIIRDSAALRLTPAGEDLLRYCQTKESLEQEVLAKFSQGQHVTAGTVRIAAFSSVARSVILPALAPLLRSNEQLRLEAFSRELRDLQSMLTKSEADFIVTTLATSRHDIESVMLGQEEYVLVESTNGNTPDDLYLDHDPEDETTFAFLASQGRPLQPTVRRSFLDEIYAIIDAVGLGLGRAVVPRHLVADNATVRLVEGYSPYLIPVFLQHYRQPFYSAVHLQVREALQTSAPAFLRPRQRSEHD